MDYNWYRYFFDRAYILLYFYILKSSPSGLLGSDGWSFIKAVQMEMALQRASWVRK